MIRYKAGCVEVAAEVSSSTSTPFNHLALKMISLVFMRPISGLMVSEDKFANFSLWHV
jgi:hypothetical protein